MVTICIALYACVADPETKIASTQTSASLASLSEAEESFKRLYIQEIDKSRDLVKRSLLARAVVNKVKEAANDLEEKGDLLTLSMVIEAEEKAVRDLTEMAEHFQTPDELVKKKRQDFLDLALRLPQDDPNRKKLEAQAAAPELISKSLLDQLFVLMQLKAMRTEAERGLNELRDHITNLQEVHSAIDQWIQMDVKPSGEDVAKLVDEHAHFSARRK
jgi:hypothetical protein